MAPAVSSKDVTSSLKRTAKREQTRAKMLDAALGIIVDEGMRAVRHRAVANRAGVALGTTTYHFSSIEELILSIFEYWRGERTMQSNSYHQEMVALLSPWEGGLVPVSRRKEVAKLLYEASVGYLYDQLTGSWEDRIIEMAFYHESMCYQSLRELVLSMWRLQLDFLEEVHRMMGSKQPATDAQITSCVFRQLEQYALMEGRSDVDIEKIRQCLHRHMSMCFGITLAQGD